jgi:hypothetical protein
VGRLRIDAGPSLAVDTTGSAAQDQSGVRPE